MQTIKNICESPRRILTSHEPTMLKAMLEPTPGYNGAYSVEGYFVFAENGNGKNLIIRNNSLVLCSLYPVM